MTQANNVAIESSQINSSGVLQPAGGGTGVTTTTGSGNAVLSTSPTLVTPALGTPASGTLTNCTFPTLNQNTTGSAGSVANALTISSPLTGTSYNGSSAVSIGIPAATTSASGYLTSTDWTTFNNKQAALVSGTNIKTVNSTSLLGSGDVGVGVTSITVSAGTGMSGGGTVTTSGTVTLTNAGVTSVAAGTGISVSGSTGGVTITNSAPAVTAGEAKAWVCFGGGSGNTAGTIYASYNVSSVTRSSTGNYTIAFTSSLADANYVAVSNGTWDNTSANNVAIVGPTYGSQNTTANCYVSCRNTNSQAAFDNWRNYVACFR